MIDRLWRDVRYGVRRLLRAPTFTAVAVGTLALGIGATTAIFSVVDGLLLRDLPYDEPDELVTVWLDMTRLGGPPREWFTYADFEDFRDEPGLFQEMGAWGGWRPTLTGAGDPVVLSGGVVTAGLLEGVLRAEPELGRAFLPEEDVPGGANVVVLSHGLWQDRFAGDTEILGRRLDLNDVPYTVIGVMREGFEPPFLPAAELWAPMQFDVSNCGRGCFTIRTVARLEAGMPVEEGRARAAALADRLAAEYPETNASVGVSLFGLQDDLVRPAAQALWVLLGAVGLVLLMACTNVANLLLARGEARGEEIALRGALGADRGSILRQLLTESLILAAAGGVAGLALAGWGTDMLLRMAPPLAFPGIGSVGVDGRVLVFAALITAGTGLLFGLMPALRSSRPDIYDRARGGGRGHGGARPSVRGGLVVTQIGIALVLLVGSGLLLRSFARLAGADLGFDADQVLALQLSLPAARFSEGSERIAFYDELLDRLESLPGVVSAGGTNALPLAGLDEDSDFRVEGQPPPTPTDPSVAWVRRITRGYFATMGISLLAGREFDARDGAEAPPVVIVNEALARRHLGYPDRDPVGTRVTFGGGPDPVWRTVVGVAPDTRHFGVRDGVRPAMYFPYPQVPTTTMALVVRTEGEPISVANAARSEVSDLDPQLAASSVAPLQNLVARATAVERFVAGLLALFAGVALILASVGLYGLVTFGVTRRSHEIGIRLALGARRNDVRRLVVLGGIGTTLVGIVLGLAGAWALSGFLEALVYEVPVRDAVTFLAMAALLAGVALFASWLPAERASRSDPAEILRVE